MFVRICGLLLFTFISPSLCAGEAPVSGKLDPNISSVASAYSETIGQCRVVVTNAGWEHISSRLKLEWLAEGPAQSWVIQKTVSIEEFDIGAWSVGMPIWSPEKSEFSLSATHTYSGEDQKFVLKPLAAGKYKLSKIK